MTRISDVTDGNMTQFKGLLAGAGLEAEDILFVNEDRTGGRARIMVDAIRAHRAAEARKAEAFENEQVESTYGYPQGWQLKCLSAQVGILVGRFPGLDVSHVDELAARYYVDETAGGYRVAPNKGKKLVMPKGMDGLVVIPKPSAIARLVAERSLRQNVVVPDMPAENLALWELLGVMSAARSNFNDYAERDVGPKRYRLTEKTRKAYAAFDDLPGDVMVLAVQTGFLHRGKSVRRARFVFGEREFGLCAFAVGIILLTHHARLTHVDHLWIDCAGSEFAPESDVDFACCPIWNFRGDELGFDWRRVSDCDPGCGSASGASSECSA